MMPTAAPWYLVVSIGVMPQSDNDALLTLKALAEQLGVGYSRLRGFADAPGMSAFLGAVNVPGVKGVRYPPSAEADFRYLIDAQDRGLVTPKTAAAFLRNRTEEPMGSRNAIVALPQGSNGMAGGDIVPMPQSGNAAGELLAALEALTAALKQQTKAAAPADRALTREEAARLLACSPRAVGRYVPALRPGVYRESDVQEYLATGRSQRKTATH